MGAKSSTAAARPQSKSKGGRPQIPFTEKQLEQAKSMSAYGLTVEQVAAVLGMSKDTFERRMKTVPDGFAALEAARASGISMVAQSGYKQATGYWKQERYTGEDGKLKVKETNEWIPPNFRATQFFLNVKAHWVERKAIDLANADDGPFEVVITDYRGKK